MESLCLWSLINRWWAIESFPWSVCALSGVGVAENKEMATDLNLEDLHVCYLVKWVDGWR